MTYRRITAFVIFCLLIVVTHSCTLYDRYERPCADIPDDWRVETDESNTIANNRWWEEFGDLALNCLIADALDYNNDLMIATCRVEEFYARLGIATSALFPQVNATFSGTRQELSLLGNPFFSSSSKDPLFSKMFGFTRFNGMWQLLVNASYEVDLWGRIRSATYAARADLLASEEARRTVIITIVTSVAAAYVQLRQYDMQYEISKHTYETRIQSLKIAQLRFEGGLTSEMEVKQAASEVENALTEVKQLEINIPQQENLISILVGHPPQDITRGLALDELEMPMCVPAGLPSDLLNQRPDILQAEDLLIASNFRVGEARALFFPTINLTGYYGGQSNALNTIFSNPATSWLYMGLATQPLFTGGRIWSQVELAEAIKCEAYYNYQQVILIALREVNDALIAHEKTLELVEVQRRRVQVVQDYLKLANLQYNNGQSDYLNVLDAERNLFNAQLDYAQAKSQSFVTLISLYKALGGGWVVDADYYTLTKEVEICNENDL